MRLEIKFTAQFKRDVKLLSKQHKNLDLLFNTIEKLANMETLDSKYKDHNLSGDFYGCRECHIEPDFLLIYEIHNDIMVLLLVRTGSHSNLFK